MVKNPQYNPGVSPGFNRNYPGSLNRDINGNSAPLTVTSGFYEDEYHYFTLTYGRREQPDRGGALKYAYENYGLPLNDVCGPFMVASNPSRPIGSPVLNYNNISVPTNVGGLVPGQFISQPLLDPNGNGSGFDIYS